ncbi:MAG: glycosyltransferase family 39 protein [Candidatus Microthrix parvicella]
MPTEQRSADARGAELAGRAMVPTTDDGGRGGSGRMAALRSRLVTWAGDPLFWVGLAAAVFGVAARAWVIDGPMGIPDLDAATVATQANQFLDGRLGVFFLNQPYGGTPEVALVAGAFAIGGSNVFMLKLVPLVLHVVAVVLCWRVARRITEDRLARLLAPCIAWVFPAGMVWNSTKERGFYGIAIVLAALTMLLALRIDQEDAGPVDVMALGLVAGVGWWTTPLLAPVALAAGGWVIARSKPARRRLPILIGSTVVGAAPWLAWNVTNRWESLTGGRLKGLDWLDGASAWLRSLGLLSGTATPWDLDRNLLPWWLGAALLGLALAVAWRRTRHAVGWFLPGIVIVSGLTAPLNLVLALSPGAPRYLYPLVPTLAVVIAVLVPHRRRGGDALWAVGVVALLASTTVWGLQGMESLAKYDVPNSFIASPGIERVVRYLEKRGHTVVTTDTAGMQIHFLSGGKIIASSFGAPRVVEFEQLALAVPETTFVLEDGGLKNAKRLQGWAYFSGTPIAEEVHIGSYWVISFDQRVTPREAGLVVYGGRPPPEAGGDDAPQ